METANCGGCYYISFPTKAANTLPTALLSSHWLFWLVLCKFLTPLCQLMQKRRIKSTFFSWDPLILLGGAFSNMKNICIKERLLCLWQQSELQREITLPGTKSYFTLHNLNVQQFESAGKLLLSSTHTRTKGADYSPKKYNNKAVHLMNPHNFWNKFCSYWSLVGFSYWLLSSQ